MASRKTRLIRITGVLLVCLGGLAPLNVFYHEVRFYIKHIVDSETARIPEFELLRGALQGERVALVEPKGLTFLENLSRLNQAQFALAPSIVTQKERLDVRIVNRKVPGAPGRAAVVRETAGYVLVRDP